jgi:prephenate dehydrogenase
VAAPALFRRVAIVGVGLIGGSIGLALRRRLPAVRVVGHDRPAVLRRARARGAIGAAAPTLAGAVRGADLVVLALPIDRLVALLPRLARLAPPAAVVTDVAGAKTVVGRAARRAGFGARFVGGHPMAGSERSGIEAADAALFEGAPWILCPPRRGEAGRRATRRLVRLVRRLGAAPRILTEEEHDRSVARLSHLPQLLAVALVNAAGRRGAVAGTAGPAFAAMSRIALSPPSIWNGVLSANRRAIAPAVADCARELRRLQATLEGGTAPLFRRAARTRDRILGRGGAR